MKDLQCEAPALCVMELGGVMQCSLISRGALTHKAGGRCLPAVTERLIWKSCRHCHKIVFSLLTSLVAQAVSERLSQHVLRNYTQFVAGVAEVSALEAHLINAHVYAKVSPAKMPTVAGRDPRNPTSKCALRCASASSVSILLRWGRRHERTWAWYVRTSQWAPGWPLARAASRRAAATCM